MQDIAPNVQTRDSEKVNTAISMPKMFFKPHSTMKRAFTAVDGEETIALKRARKYLGSDEAEEIVQSPFFSKKRGSVIVQQPASSEAIEETGLHTNVEEILGNVESVDVRRDEEMVETIKERQVSESPPRMKATGIIETNEDEVIPDSPAGPIRTKTFHPDSIDEVNDIFQTSPEFQSNNHNVFLPSPPPSRQNPPPILPRPSNHTPILRPGTKKAYTPRPSHSNFPDTPTPSNHTLIVQGWKDRFTSKLTNTISNRPITPLHTPILRRKIVTPASASTAGLGRHSSSRAGVEEIEEVSPPRGRIVCLDRFRFTPH